jgi:rod shape-determining protein MreD
VDSELGRADHGLWIMSPYLVCLLLAAIVLAQTTLSPRLALMGVQPNLMLLAILSWSLLRRGREGMLWAFAGGILLDMVSGAPLGASSISLLLVSFVSGLGEVSVFRTSLSLPLLVSLVGSLLHDAVFLAVLALMGWSVDWPASLWRVMLPAAGLNTAFMPLVYILLRWLHERTKEAELAW